jgi:hypothetical protein
VADGAASSEGPGDPPAGPFSPPDEHPAAKTSTRAAITAVTAGRCTVLIPSTAAVLLPSCSSYTAAALQVPDLAEKPAHA